MNQGYTTIGSVIFAMLVLLCTPAGETYAETIGMLASGTCGGVPDYDDIANNRGGAQSCGGGNIFSVSPSVSASFHYEAQFKAGYNDLDNLTPVLGGLTADTFKGFAKIVHVPTMLDLKIKSQVEAQIPARTSFLSYGADGGISLVAHIFDPTVGENDEIPIQLSVQYGVSIKCEIDLSCSIGTNWELASKSQTTNLWEQQIFGSKFLSAGPGQNNFFIDPQFGNQADCFFNSKENYNECIINMSNVVEIPVINNLNYGLSFSSFTGFNTSTGGWANVDNANSWTATIAPTEANPNAIIILVPEPTTFLILTAGSLIAIRRRK